MLVTSTLTCPKLSLVLKALHASDLPNDCLCSDDVDTPEATSSGVSAIPTLFPNRPQAAVPVRTARAQDRKPGACLSLFGPAGASEPTDSIAVAMTDLPAALDAMLHRARALPDA